MKNSMSLEGLNKTHGNRANVQLQDRFSNRQDPSKSQCQICNFSHLIGELNYEKRIKELANNKVVQSHLSSKVIETWLNETIVASSHLEIPGIILKPEHKKPLSRYGIDRNQFLQGNIPHHSIDRIYRALFVYSLGFYEMLSKVLNGSTQKNIFQSAIWKVFAILLEYCCKTNYKMLIN